MTDQQVLSNPKHITLKRGMEVKSRTSIPASFGRITRIEKQGCETRVHVSLPTMDVSYPRHQFDAMCYVVTTPER